MSNSEFRDHVRNRALDFEPEVFWSELCRNLQGVEAEISGDAEEFGANTVENVERLSGS